MALTFNNGQVSFSFQMDPITDTTVTIMGTKTSSTGETYYGTIDNVTLEEFGTYNSPTVMLGRRKDLSAGSITAANDDYIFQSSNRESTGNTITIPNGVTVTIEGVNISPSGKAGINCEGNANIILKGSNSIQGGYGYPAVQGGCSGTTLTISGSGSLTATGGYGSAGIGSGHGGECGDIIISGGTGSATKGDSAPCSIGKGLACNTCGTIIIGTTVYPDGITISPFTWSITP